MAAKPLPLQFELLESFIFVTEPADALKCLICHEVAGDPQQHDQCGRIYCKKCLDEYGRHKPCPFCRKNRPQYFKDSKSHREIKALQVRCDNEDVKTKRRCPWKGTFDEAGKHEVTCQLTLISCPNQCHDTDNTVKRFMRKEMVTHLKNKCPNREFKCEHCGEEGTFANIKQVHDKICPYKTLPCPNYPNCADSTPRAGMKRHLEEECQHAVIPCKYQKLGCKVEMKRNALSPHENEDKLHLHMALDTIVAMEASARTAILKNKESMTFRLSGFQKMKEKNEVFLSDPFYTHPEGYCMQIVVVTCGYDDGLGTHISVGAKLLKGLHDEQLKWPFQGEICITLLNQKADRNHMLKTVYMGNKTGEGEIDGYVGIPKFIAHSQLNTNYLVDDTLYFKVAVKVANHKSWLERTA